MTVVSKEIMTIRRAFIGSQMVQEPFVALYSLLGIFLTKQLQATPFELAVLTMLKPMVSVFSFYWGSYLLRRRSTLRSNALVATSFAVVPFLFAPFISQSWFFVAAGALYALFSKAAIPAKMELLKTTVPQGQREHLFSNASSLAYAIGVLSSLSFGPLLDIHPEWWTILFSLSALVSLVSLGFLVSIPAPEITDEIEREMAAKEMIVRPWKSAIELLRSRPDFLHFQVGFFLAGLGLMVAMPAIPIFLTRLNISYVELFVALGVLKGLGFVLTSRVWAAALRKFPLPLVSGAIFVGFGLFLFCLLCTKISPIFVLIAYGVYGIAQAGSHLVWNLSGPIFSGSEASFQYSLVNVLAIGIRGMIGPLIGGIIAQTVSPEVAIGLGCFIGGYAVWYMCAQTLTTVPSKASL